MALASRSFHSRRPIIETSGTSSLSGPVGLAFPAKRTVVAPSAASKVSWFHGRSAPTTPSNWSSRGGRTTVNRDVDSCTGPPACTNRKVLPGTVGPGDRRSTDSMPGVARAMSLSGLAKYSYTVSTGLLMVVSHWIVPIAASLWSLLTTLGALAAVYEWVFSHVTKPCCMA